MSLLGEISEVHTTALKRNYDESIEDSAVSMCNLSKIIHLNVNKDENAKMYASAREVAVIAISIMEKLNE